MPSYDLSKLVYPPITTAWETAAANCRFEMSRHGFVGYYPDPADEGPGGLQEALLPIYIKPWSSRVDWLLSDTEDKSIAERMAYESQAVIQEIMDSLNKLKQIIAYYNGAYLTSRNQANLCLVFTPEHIRKAEINLLSALKRKYENCYSFTYANKRLVVEAQEDEIRTIQSKNGLYTFYREHKNSLAWIQHRHSIWDTLSKEPYPQSKRSILEALTQQFHQIEKGDTAPLSLDEQTPFDQDMEKVRTILRNKQTSIEAEKSLCWTIFYSSSRTRDKIQAINDSLRQLDKITHPIELALFKEKLLLNKALTSGRGLGIGASDTYEQLLQLNG